MEDVFPMEVDSAVVVGRKETKAVKREITAAMIRDPCESTCNPPLFPSLKSLIHVYRSRSSNEKSLRGRILSFARSVTYAFSRSIENPNKKGAIFGLCPISQEKWAPFHKKENKERKLAAALFLSFLVTLERKSKDIDCE